MLLVIIAKELLAVVTRNEEMSKQVTAVSDEEETTKTLHMHIEKKMRGFSSHQNEIKRIYESLILLQQNEIKRITTEKIK